MEVMNMASISLSCCIKHPTLDAGLITDFMGVEPDVYQQYGEAVTLPDGTRLDHKYSYTKWFITEDDISSDNIIGSLSALVEFLETKEEYLLDLHQRGAKCSIFYFITSPNKITFMMPSDLIDKLAKMKIDFGLETFN